MQRSEAERVARHLRHRAGQSGLGKERGRRLPANDVELGGGAVDGLPRSQPCDHPDHDHEGPPAVVPDHRREAVRAVHVHAVAAGEAEAGRGDAPDHRRPAVEPERLAHHRRVAAEAAHPEPVAQHHDRLRVELLVGGHEAAAGRERLVGQQRKEARGHHEGSDPLRLAAQGEVLVARRELHGGDRVERLGPVAPREERRMPDGVRRTRNAHRLDGDEPLRLRVGEGAQPQRPCHREHQGGRADADAQRQQHHRREAGRSPKPAQPVAYVAEQVLDGPETPCGTAVVLGRVE